MGTTVQAREEILAREETLAQEETLAREVILAPIPVVTQVCVFSNVFRRKLTEEGSGTGTGTGTGDNGTGSDTGSDTETGGDTGTHISESLRFHLTCDEIQVLAPAQTEEILVLEPAILVRVLPVATLEVVPTARMTVIMALAPAQTMAMQVRLKSLRVCHTLNIYSRRYWYR